jgi:hypothetical protein
MIDYSIHATTCAIELELIKGNSWPKWQFEQDYKILNQTETEFKKNITVLITNINSTLTMHRSGKTDLDTVIENGKIIRDQYLSVNRMWINDVSIELPVVQSLVKFYPAYSKSNIDYAQENNIQLPESTQDFSLFFNGKWEFEFRQPFFISYNQIQIEQFQDFNHWIKQSHLGFGSDQKIFRLKELLKKLS